MRTLGVAVVVVVVFGPPGRAADLSGPWGLEFRRDASVVYVADCIWEQQGTRLTGGCTSGFGSIASLRGSVEEGRVTFELEAGADDSPVIRFAGQLDDKDTAVIGTWRLVDRQGRTESGTFTASRR